MNLLMVGAGSASWQMRGVQLGAALGARVTSRPTMDDWRWADLVVLIKGAGMHWARTAHLARVPIVWDALDFWRQPDENGLAERYARQQLTDMVTAIRPVLTIGATEAMAEACDGICLSHHGRIGVQPTPARDEIRVIGYDGSPLYLNLWEDAIRSICREREWTFVVNPPDLSATDVLIALRWGRWDGWMCREWKSGVKAVNAIVAGRPLITQDSASWREVQPCGTVIEQPEELAAALDAWIPLEARSAVVAHSQARAAEFRVEAIAARYQRILQSLRIEAVAC